MIVLWPLLLITLVLGEQQSEDDFSVLSKIVGGEIANITDFPYQLSLQFKGSHGCGASLIGDKWAVTAAHCTDGAPVSGLYIRAGTSTREEGGELIKVRNVYQHQNYSSNNIDYDISVLELASVVSHPNAKPVPLADDMADVRVGALGVISGWGNTKESGSVSKYLRFVRVPIVTYRTCIAVYGPSSISDRMFCAGYSTGGKDACQGDSGGPFVVDGVLTGIISWGYGCARPKYPGVYTSVPALRSFIDSIITQKSLQ